MSYPEAYDRLFDYAGYQNANPTRPLPGDRVNMDLNAIAASFDEFSAFIRGITRADGELANGSVGYDQLDPLVIMAIRGLDAIVDVQELVDEAVANATLDVTAIDGLGTGVAAALAINIGSVGAPVVTGGALGTPSSADLALATGLPISGIDGLDTGVDDLLATFSSANLRAALDDETGTGAAVFANAPSLTNPDVTTQAPGTNSTKAASTAFVTAAITPAGAGAEIFKYLNFT